MACTSGDPSAAIRARASSIVPPMRRKFIAMMQLIGRFANNSKLNSSTRECRLGPTQATLAVRAPGIP